MQKVTKQTRADKNGTAAHCPFCDDVFIVKDFDWEQLICPTCGRIIEREEWLIDENTPHAASLIRDFLIRYLTVDVMEQILEKPINEKYLEETIIDVQHTPDYILEAEISYYQEKAIKEDNMSRKESLGQSACIFVAAMYTIIESSNNRWATNKNRFAFYQRPK